MKHKILNLGDRVMVKIYHNHPTSISLADLKSPNASSNDYREIPGIVIEKCGDSANNRMFYSVMTDEHLAFYDVPETDIRPIENAYIPKIKNVKFNGPATIIFWSDGTKTIVKAHDEAFDPEKGLAMAIAKKALGNNGNYFNEIKKWLPEDGTENISGNPFIEAVNALSNFSKCF